MIFSLSIRWRLAAGIALAFVITLAVILVTVRIFLQRTLSSDLDASLAHDVERVLAQTALLGLDDREQLQEMVDRNSATGSAPAPFITVIWDIQGNPLAAPTGLDITDLAVSSQELQQVLLGDILSQDVTLPGKQEYRVRTQRLLIGGNLVGVVQVGEGTERASRPTERLESILLAEGIAGVLLAVAIAYWLSRGALRPLEKVVDVAAEIQASGLGRRINASNQPAEVQRLADTFDAMLERLDRAFKEQRGFIYDVSHELRTPLTALRGNIDVLLMDERLERPVRELLEQLVKETDRLIRLTNNLLYLASADAGRKPERRPVELDVLCLEVYRQAKALRGDVKVALGNEDQVTLLGDRDLLKQMILNLMENGLKYTSSGGRVTLSLFGDEKEARVVVEDTGPGIPPETLPHIFERFYRGPDQNRGGTGLGLAIADWIARSHGGRISVESQVGRGSTFTVTLPLEEDGRGEVESPRAPGRRPARSGVKKA